MPHVRLTGQDVGQADGALQAQVFGDLRAAQVGVDDDDAFAGLGEGDAQVADGGARLALAGSALLTTRLRNGRSPTLTNWRFVRSWRIASARVD